MSNAASQQIEEKGTVEIQSQVQIYPHFNGSEQ
jgi:hypothetical protein